MPKLTIARVAWNPQDASYQVNEKAGQKTDLSPMDFENQTWQEWLERVPSFAFQSKDGHRFTARKETRARGSSYWVAYRKIGGKLTHTYIGRSEDITLSRLEQVAHSFIEQKSKPPAPHPRRSSRRSRMCRKARLARPNYAQAWQRSAHQYRRCPDTSWAQKPQCAHRRV